MGIETLLGQATDEQLKKLPGRVRNPERVKQHLDAFALHLQGVSYRGIQDHFGWKSLSTAENSVKRGEILAKNLNLDSEKIRLKLAVFFEEICNITLQQVREQVEAGRVTVDVDAEGNKSVRCTKGVDPRLLGEAGRGAIRFAQFAGLMDSDKSTSGGGDISTNVVFVSPQADLSEWETRTVDVTPNECKSECTGELLPANASAAQQGPTAKGAVETSDQTQQEPISGPCDSPAGMAQGDTPRIVQRGLF